MHSLLILAALMICFVACSSAATMPDYIQVCHRDDPELSKCLKRSVHNLRPYLAKGIKELNVPPLEPLYIGDLNILDGSGGLTVRAKKMNILGASNFEITKLRASTQNRRFDFELILPHLHGEGLYEINGNILALPIKGSGPFTGNFTNFVAYVRVQYDIKTVNDLDYLNVKEFALKIRTGKGNLKLENLFNGDKVLGDVINDTINQNFEVFTNDLIAPIARALEANFKVITSKILENFTYNELFPV
ncbi:circadian clock-controlled protein daywake [Drosophila rhopaloa]|uniref:Circadian clock-controlled protein n=1 Tax=Drosophila rhopaloa TaxID=1041015 RepID=A0A6P4EPV0_DRORH|nr:circadian clock-controlled protein daywake [Drosophila rhopaloa]XP_016975333.1 circadian clock-controlled protein daywake [Drosophila rhopaloa]